MNRPLSKKPDRSGKRPSSLRRLFVPTLLCLALFPASFALAEKSGGQDNIPRPNDYGNTASLTGNNVRVTGEQIRGSIFGAYTTLHIIADISFRKGTLQRIFHLPHGIK